MAESVCVRRIKDLLGEVCDLSLQLMPPQEMDIHPCDWIEKDMAKAIKEIEAVKDALYQTVQEKKKTIEELEKKRRSILFALNGKIDSTEKKDIWICKRSLYVKESILTRDLEGLSIKYEEQKKAHAGIAEQIKKKMGELAEYLVNEKECKEVTKDQIVTKELILRAETVLSDLEAREKEIRAMTEERVENIQNSLFMLGFTKEAQPVSVEELRTEIDQLETQLENISSSVESYNYTMAKIEVSDIQKKEESYRIEQKCSRVEIASISPIIHLRNHKEIMAEIDTCRHLAKYQQAEDLCIFKALENIAYSTAKEIEERTKRLLAMAEDIDYLLVSRLIFLSKRMEVNMTEDVADITCIWRILIRREWIVQIEQEYKEKIEEIFVQQKRKLEDALATLKEVTEYESESINWPEEIKDLKFTEQEEILLELERKTNDAEEECVILKRIEEFVQERKELLLKMSAFEEQASDPRRLFRSSFQLNSEEKFRKMAVPTLLRVEKEIFTLSQSYFERFKKPVQIKKEEIVKDLQEEISHRIINANTFMTGRHKTAEK